MPKLINRTARILGIGHLRLMPGKPPPETYVSDEDLATLRKSEVFGQWCSLAWVKIRPDKALALSQEPQASPPPAPLPAHELSSSDSSPDALSPLSSLDVSEPTHKGLHLSVRRAQQAIAKCDDVESLLSWYEQESRKSVRRYVEARIKQIEHQMVSSDELPATDDALDQEGTDDGS
jgi:hypothetical protein